MFDSNPQNKLVHQTNQQTNQANQQAKQYQTPQFAANPKTEIPTQNPSTGDIKEKHPKLKQEATKQKQEDKKGFKAALQEAKQSVIAKGKQKMIQKGSEAVNNFTSPDQPDESQPNPQVDKPVKCNPPIPEKPQPSIPTANTPTQKPPTLRVPKTQFKMPKFRGI